MKSRQRPKASRDLGDLGDMDVVAVDLGGTNIRAARIDAAGKILARKKVPTKGSEGMPAVAVRIAALIKSVRGPNTQGVGVGTPGVPDPKTGVMRLPAVNIAGSLGFPLTETLAKATGLPVSADNDGNLAALGESWLGAGVGEHVVIIFTLGTGIGGGFVMDGKVYHGNHNLGTEFGHVSIDFKGRKCPCGGFGCIERYASASALGRDAQDALRDKTINNGAKSALFKQCGGPKGIESLDARMVCEAARAGDPLAKFLLDRCCDWLACAMGGLINAFNPSCVIVGGGMALAGELLTTRIARSLDNGRAFGPIWKDCKLRLAMLGDDAGLLGAGKLALQQIAVPATR